MIIPRSDLIRSGVLVDELGLKTVRMASTAAIMDDLVLQDLNSVGRTFGRSTADAVQNFRDFCVREISPRDYYDSSPKDDNAHQVARITGHELLRKMVPDHAARRYVRIMAHSDIAAPMHLTSGLNLIKNVLMDVEGYLDLYSIEGGIERLTQMLAERLIETDAVDVVLGTAVLDVGRTESNRYRVTMRRAGIESVREFDLLFLALPLNWLSTLRWRGDGLERAMVQHIKHFDRPAHYLRVSVLFDTPFWRDHVKGSWWMSDAFSGCCVYDEGARHETGMNGVLGWLIAGGDALAMANLDDEVLLEKVLDSLPTVMRHGIAQVREAAVHRWLAAVNAIPGGIPCRDSRTNHVPEPRNFIQDCSSLVTTCSMQRSTACSILRTRQPIWL